MKQLLFSISVYALALVQLSYACETKFVWHEAWTDSCDGLSLPDTPYKATFKAKGKWYVFQKENGAWVQKDDLSFTTYKVETSQWRWRGDVSGKMAVLSGGNTGTITVTFDEPDAGKDKYEISVGPAGDGAQQQYVSPKGNVGDKTMTKAVKVTINRQ